MPARRPALDEGPHGDAVAVPVARQVCPEQGHVVNLAALRERDSSVSILIREKIADLGLAFLSRDTFLIFNRCGKV